MKTVISSKGQIVVPAAIRRQDNILPGQEFEIERLKGGEYLLRRTRRRNEGLVQLLLDCPVKGWFQAASRDETTGDVLPPKMR
jgi:AbrB family looped-hinge helix DNA binding protein